MLCKNPENYEKIPNKTNIYEQKPINIDDFNEVEENKIKERVEKRKQKRREVAGKNKQLKKRKRKQEETKRKEKDMWKRLSQLNVEFKEIEKSRKDAKKMSDIVRKH